MNPSLDPESFCPQPAGEVYRLTSDWQKLIQVFPRLHVGAVVQRCSHAIYCQAGRFPAVDIVGARAFASDGFRGASFDMEGWGEAWMYEEERLGQMLTCLEVADEQGRGLFKLCYRRKEDATADAALLADLCEERADAWDLLHLRRSNVMDCSNCCGKQTAEPRYLGALRAVQQEAVEKGVELGLIMPHAHQSAWDSLAAMVTQPAPCWLGFAKGNHHVAIQPGGYHSLEVTRSAERSVLSFFLKNGDPALSLVQPEGSTLKTFDALRELSR